MDTLGDFAPSAACLLFWLAALPLAAVVIAISDEIESFLLTPRWNFL